MYSVVTFIVRSNIIWISLFRYYYFCVCHVDQLDVISLLYLVSKPSVNEHMIQMCHLDFVYLLFRFYAIKWNVIFNSVNYHLASNVTGLVFCVPYKFTLRVKVLWFFCWFLTHSLIRARVSSICHLLLIKLKLDGNHCHHTNMVSVGREATSITGCNKMFCATSDSTTTETIIQ